MLRGGQGAAESGAVIVRRTIRMRALGLIPVLGLSGALGAVAIAAQPAAEAGIAVSTDAAAGPLEEAAAERFAHLALACLHKEYPNKVGHVMVSDADAQPPRLLTPAFYGCFDWHSDVHGHWLLIRLLRLFPDGAFAREARERLAAARAQEK